MAGCWLPGCLRCRVKQSVRCAGPNSPHWPACLDDGGGQLGSTFQTCTCNATASSQKFAYSPATFQLTNPDKPGLCMDTGGGTYNGASLYSWGSCDAANTNQKFAFDSSTGILHSMNWDGLCLDMHFPDSPDAGQQCWTWGWTWGCGPGTSQQFG